MATTFAGLLEWYARVERELSQPQVFFTAHEARYLEMARRVSIQTMQSMRPPDKDPVDWNESAADFASLIFARPLAPGLEIVFAGRTAFDRQDARNQGNAPGNFTPITYQDVLDWVKAGVENGGKDITAVESSRGRNPEQIAYDVLTAIRQHRLGVEKKDYSRITERLEEWINQRVVSGDMDAILTAIHEAWLMALAPVIERDFSDWVANDVLRGS